MVETPKAGQDTDLNGLVAFYDNNSILPPSFRCVKSKADWGDAWLIVCSYLATGLLKAIQVYRNSGQICDQLGISFLDHLPADFFSSSDANNTNLSSGKPLLRHCDTAGGLTRQSLATANVPPNVCMISVVFM